MTNAELLAKIKAEIERRRYVFNHKAVYRELDELLSFLDTLESEKPMNQDEVVINGHKVEYDKDKDAITMEEIPNDLEEAANKYAEEHGFRVPYDGSNNFYDDVDVRASKEGFIAGAKWQEERDQETIKLSEINPFLAGVNYQKEQMMKEAVEGTIDYVYDEKGDAYKAIRLDRLVGDFGDKVKLYIVKED